MIGDSNAALIYRHLTDTQDMTYKFKSAYTVPQLHKVILNQKEEINSYDVILIHIGTNNLKHGELAHEIHENILTATNELNMDKTIFLEPPRMEAINHEIEKKTLTGLQQESGLKTTNPYPISTKLQPDGLHITDPIANIAAKNIETFLMDTNHDNQPMDIDTRNREPVNTQPIRQPSHNTQDNRTQNPKEYTRQTERQRTENRGHQEPEQKRQTQQTTQRPNMTIYKRETKVENHLVKHVFGKEGKKIHQITQDNYTRATYDSKTETMIITGTTPQKVDTTIDEINQITDYRRQQEHREEYHTKDRPREVSPPTTRDRSPHRPQEPPTYRTNRTQYKTRDRSPYKPQETPTHRERDRTRRYNIPQHRHTTPEHYHYQEEERPYRQ